MGHRRSITTRAKLLYQQRFSPSFAYIHHGDDRKHNSVSEDQKFPSIIQHRSFGNSIYTSSGLGALFQAKNCSQLFVPMNSGMLLSRNMSTTVGEGADKIDYMTDVAEVLADRTIEAVASQAPAVSEVAIAAADSYFPVAALHYVIDYLHTFTGFNWWASIVVTTLLIRGLSVPLMISQLKATSKLTLMRPHLEEIKEEMQDRGMSPTAVAEGQQRMKQLFREYGVTPWTPLKGLLFQGPVFVSFFLAISNMVEKVPSFKEGGAFWFTDLTTPDSLYIFPALTALTFWITVEAGRLRWDAWPAHRCGLACLYILFVWLQLVSHNNTASCYLWDSPKDVLLPLDVDRVRSPSSPAIGPSTFVRRATDFMVRSRVIEEFG
ncbi:unnamed protein product [Ilex paraguariensis]|uniref:Membrane insertase YidC/Oxa/ALB C-terminal domain-containing protein n=1 Tax=Ilex paraguariensis TaxID=185542 RepID=A0ABC8RJG0_9AQUA